MRKPCPAQSSVLRRHDEPAVSRLQAAPRTQNEPHQNNGIRGDSVDVHKSLPDDDSAQRHHASFYRCAASDAGAIRSLGLHVPFHHSTAPLLVFDCQPVTLQILRICQLKAIAPRDNLYQNHQPRNRSRHCLRRRSVSGISRCQPAGSSTCFADSEKAVESLDGLDDSDAALAGHLLLKVPKIAAQLGLTDGYRTVINTGSNGGQTVFHLHIHIMGGRGLTWPPG